MISSREHLIAEIGLVPKPMLIVNGPGLMRLVLRMVNPSGMEMLMVHLRLLDA
ncbi:MAG: hypothetical protein NT070_10050 [Cyanobacteria bacterium]|nr:hypothetical protein [Cyanobacteriota bacterium]